jgi:RimJ/RimL family protein N-acetyltransferase
VDKIFRNPQNRRPAVAQTAPSASALARSWREALPVLTGATYTLREPAVADAAALLMALGSHELRDLAPLAATPTIAGVEALIASAHEHREAGTAACWAIVPRDAESPVGLVVVQALDHAFTMVGVTAVVATEFRGTGLFQAAARALLDGLFGSLGVHRVEVRVDVRNARANGALRKLGATQEGVLRHAQYRDGTYRDQVLWAMVAGDWATHRDLEPPRVH